MCSWSAGCALVVSALAGTLRVFFGTSFCAQVVPKSGLRRAHLPIVEVSAHSGWLIHVATAIGCERRVVRRTLAHGVVGDGGGLFCQNAGVVRDCFWASGV